MSHPSSAGGSLSSGFRPSTDSTDPTSRESHLAPEAGLGRDDAAGGGAATLLPEAAAGGSAAAAAADEEGGAATTEAARTALVTHLSSLGADAMAPLSQRASDIGAAHAAIDRQRRDVDGATAGLAAATDAAAREMQKARDVLKQAGDLDNWAEMLERDIWVLEETLRIVDAGEEEGEEDEEEEQEQEEQQTGSDAGDEYRNERERDGAEGNVLAHERPVTAAKNKEKKPKGRNSWLWGIWPGATSASADSL